MEPMGIVYHKLTYATAREMVEVIMCSGAWRREEGLSPPYIGGLTHQC